MDSDTHRINKRYTVGHLVEWCGGSTAMSINQLLKPAGVLKQDSRTIGKNDIFIALSTDKNDGHGYVDSAFRAGAYAAIVSRKNKIEVSANYSDKLIYVNDPLRSIQRAARKYRTDLGILMIGITGSSGKTTTRNFIASVLKRQFVVGETYTNWNNHIGVPLSMLKFTGDEWIGVIEMGANHLGEIQTLSKITQPDIGIVTNIGYAHVGLFGSLKNTASAKMEIAAGLNRKEGFLLLNGDDARLVAEARLSGLKTVFFGYSKKCSVVPEKVVIDPRQGCIFSVDGDEFHIRMPGRHFIYSALPALFLGRRCGMPYESIASALQSIAPVELRGTIERINGVELIADCYNANPSSMVQALVYLNDVAGKKRKIAVLGEMFELEHYSNRLHHELGKNVAKHGINKLITVGKSSRLVAQGACKAGMSSRDIIETENAGNAYIVLKGIVRSGDTVLVKGSRSVHLETVCEKMRGNI